MALAPGDRRQHRLDRVVAGRASDLDPWIDASVIVKSCDLHLDQVLGVAGSRLLEVDIHPRRNVDGGRWRTRKTTSHVPFPYRSRVDIRCIRFGPAGSQPGDAASHQKSNSGPVMEYRSSSPKATKAANRAIAAPMKARFRMKISC